MKENEMTTEKNGQGAPVDRVVHASWHYEDELPEGYPYETAFRRSKVIDGVRMFPPMASVQDAKATTRKLAMDAENAIFEALALSGEPISKDTETWLNAAAMLVRRAIESI